MKPREASIPWSDEEMAIVAECLADGMTAAQIAERTQRTRNAILGVVNRTQALKAIGFKGSHGPRNTRPKTVPLGGNRFKKLVQVATKSQRVDKPLPSWTEHAGAPEPRNLPLLDIGWNECCWPVNNPAKGGQHLFCGHPSGSKSRYCDHHHFVSCSNVSVMREAA